MRSAKESLSRSSARVAPLSSSEAREAEIASQETNPQALSEVKRPLWGQIGQGSSYLFAAAFSLGGCVVNPVGTLASITACLACDKIEGLAADESKTKDVDWKNWKDQDFWGKVKLAARAGKYVSAIVGLGVVSAANPAFGLSTGLATAAGHVAKKASDYKMKKDDDNHGIDPSFARSGVGRALDLEVGTEKVDLPVVPGLGREEKKQDGANGKELATPSLKSRAKSGTDDLFLESIEEDGEGLDAKSTPAKAANGASASQLDSKHSRGLESK